MRRIVLSSLVVLGLVAAVTGATLANFSDTETSTENTFAAGTLDLKTNDADGVTKGYTLADIHPGETKDAGRVRLKNTGTVNGKVWLEIKNVQNFENTCTEAEVESGDTTCVNGVNGGGELGSILKAKFNRYGTGSYFWTDLPLNSSVGKRVDLFNLNAGQEIWLDLYGVWQPVSWDNKAQTDRTTFDVVFHLEQI